MIIFTLLQGFRYSPNSLLSICCKWLMINLNFTPSRQGPSLRSLRFFSQNNISNKKTSNNNMLWHEFRINQQLLHQNLQNPKMHKTSRHHRHQTSKIYSIAPRPLERGRLNSSATPRLVCFNFLIKFGIAETTGISYANIVASLLERPFTGDHIHALFMLW